MSGVLIRISGDPVQRGRAASLISRALNGLEVDVTVGLGLDADELIVGDIPVDKPPALSVGVAKIGKDKTAKQLKKIVKLLEAMQGAKAAVEPTYSQEAVIDFRSAAVEINVTGCKPGSLSEIKCRSVIDTYGGMRDERAPAFIRDGMAMAEAALSEQDPAMYQMAELYIRNHKVK